MQGVNLIEKIEQLKHKSRMFYTDFVQQIGLTTIEFRIIDNIFRNKENNIEVTASNLAETYNVSISAIMHKLESLESKNFVVKRVSVSDKRIKYYDISDFAYEICSQAHHMYMKRWTKFLDYLGEEAHHLEMILDKCLEYMEENND